MEFRARTEHAGMGDQINYTNETLTRGLVRCFTPQAPYRQSGDVSLNTTQGCRRMGRDVDRARAFFTPRAFPDASLPCDDA